MPWLTAFAIGAIGWLLTQQFNVIRNFALWTWDQLLSVVDFAVGLVPAGSLTSLPSVGTLPADFLNMWGYLGGWQAMGMVGSALSLRLVLGWIIK